MTAPPGPLSTERLTLEPVLPAHAELLMADLHDKRLYRFMEGSAPPRLRELRARFREVRRGAGREREDRALMWAARAAGERSYVGLFEATLSKEGLANLGYLIFSRAQRRGYALEACRRIVSHLGEDHGVRAVIAVTHADNVPARRLAERLGFRASSGYPTSGDGMVGYVFRRTEAAAR